MNIKDQISDDVYSAIHTAIQGPINLQIHWQLARYLFGESHDRVFDAMRENYIKVKQQTHQASDMIKANLYSSL